MVVAITDSMASWLGFNSRPCKRSAQAGAISGQGRSRTIHLRLVKFIFLRAFHAGTNREQFCFCPSTGLNVNSLWLHRRRRCSHFDGLWLNTERRISILSSPEIQCFQQVSPRSGCVVFVISSHLHRVTSGRAGFEKITRSATRSSKASGKA